MADRYYVIILDIVGSSKVPDREKVTTQINAANIQANQIWGQDIWAAFEITKGDEIAAVLTSPEHVYDMILHYHKLLEPIELRAALFYGELSAGLSTRRSTVIDGPAFYEVNKKMIHLKKTQKRVALYTGLDELDSAAEALINLVLWRWKILTPLQREIIRDYQNLRNQAKVAELLQKTQQQVQKTLDACKWEILDDAETAIRNLLEVIHYKIANEGKR